jgi:hypothetical protein
MPNTKLDKPTQERIKNLLKTVATNFDQEDRAARERQLRNWRRLKLLWEGFQRVWYSEVAHDWRIWDEEISNADNDQAFYDKPINVFRAYLESLIAALSITIPAIKCFPDDAENPIDLSTAKAGDKIAELIYRHNDAPILWLHALYINMTEGMTAMYSYPKSDKEYGTYKENVYKKENIEAYICPICKNQLDDDLFTKQEIDEFQPDDDDIELHNLIINENQVVCPQCAAQLDPSLQKSPLVVTRFVDQKEVPKSRICMEVYGGLYVKVPNYAMKQADCPYLIFSYETHYTNALDRYDHLRDKFDSNGKKIGPAGGGMYDPYEQWARLSPQYRGEYPLNNVTVRNCWLRPSAFNVLNEEDTKLLKKHYPDGAKLVLVNDEWAADENESLDDCWTIIKNPLSDYIHYYPTGSLLVSVQDITSDLISLVLQTIEHGIQQTFADPGVLNFEKYREAETMPGGIYPAVPKTGKSVGDGFFETRTATLSQEVLPFFNMIQTLGQSVSGAQPSLFGGQLSGSRTASEYSMSRAQALQRLQNTWKTYTLWWKQIFAKVIPMYIQEVQEDEKSTERNEQGNFINVFIRKAELEGRIGRVELEANENLPITWSQRKDTYMELLKLQNPEILKALADPENVKSLVEAIGLDDFTVPGEDDRQKQYEEIRLLINSEPIEIPVDPMIAAQAVMSGQPPPPDTEEPSVGIDPDLDNHDIEAEVCRTYLVSDAGRLLKIENPLGYKNVLLHMKEHMKQIQMSMGTAPQAPMPPAGGGPTPPQPTGTNMPLAENDNVSAQA